MRHAWLALTLVLASSSARALEVPELKARVNDYAGVLTPERAKVIENQLAAHQRSTGQQFALLTVKSLEGDALEDFSIRVAEAWQLGDKERDDGLVLIVVSAERKVRIEVGYGLEGAIPDAVAARVIREIIAPAFRRGEYGLGIELGFDALMQAAGGEASTARDEGESVTEPPRGKPASSLLNLIPFFLMIIFLFSIGGGRGGRGGGMLAGAMLASMGRMGGGGRYHGGGGGGGGFRGGGGGFGGGGASGGW